MPYTRPVSVLRTTPSSLPPFSQVSDARLVTGLIMGVRNCTSTASGSHGSLAHLVSYPASIVSTSARSAGENPLSMRVR
jgi:hypothetical protein